MNLIRPTVKLHTIEEWSRLDPSIRPVILANIKLKDRLWKWLKDQQKRELKPLDNPKWGPCHACDKVGWILHEPRYPGIHPSQITNPCDLKIFLDMLGEPGEQSHEARLQLVFDFGTALHRLFQSYGARGAWGPHYSPEAKISSQFQKLADDLMIEGHADADTILVLDEIPNSSSIYEVGIVHEYKSINSHGFKGLTKPKSDHKIQATFYAAALNRPVVSYLYMNKDDSNLADFPVAFDHSVWEVLSTKAAKLKGYFDAYVQAEANNQAPVMPDANVGFHCSECSYAKTCKPYQDNKPKRR